MPKDIKKFSGAAMSDKEREFLRTGKNKKKTLGERAKELSGTAMSDKERADLQSVVSKKRKKAFSK